MNAVLHNTPFATVRLLDVARGRDNNLNLIRFVAASLVLISHSYALFFGDGAVEPWRETLGISMGRVAVDIFFCVSGYLVAGSLISSGSVRDFLLARFLRIYPGLWVALLLSTTVVGLCASTLSSNDFFTNAETAKYLIKNAIIIFGVAHYLPGVFENNPWSGAVNGSLWTLPHEVRAYLTLVLLWAVAIALRRRIGISFANICVAFTVGLLTFVIYAIAVDWELRFLGLLVIFMSGVLYRIYSQFVILRIWLAMVLLAALGLALQFGHQAFQLTYIFALPYILMCAIYLPKGYIRSFNRVGDYSYGLYVYAFPVQQLLMANGVNSVAQLTMASFLITAGLAVMSWHIVEKKALTLRNVWRPHAH